MKKNMGSADRIIRIIIAAIIGYLFYAEIISGTLGVVLLILAAIFLLTSFVNFCPLYAPFGFSTCKGKRVNFFESKKFYRISNQVLIFISNTFVLFGILFS